MPKILAIENIPGRLEACKITLNSMGFTGPDSQFVGSVSKGLAIAQNTPPDLMIINLLMLTAETSNDIQQYKADHPKMKLIGITRKTTDGDYENFDIFSPLKPGKLLIEGFASSELISSIQTLLPKECALSNHAKKVLVIEDSRMLQKMYMMYITNAGLVNKVHLIICDNAEDGIAQLEKQEFDMMLLDWELPGMDGLQCLKTIRQNPRWKALPIIMSTQISNKQKIISAIQSGVNDYIIKPIKPDIFISKVKSRLKI